jgi:hypothetical protein
MSHGMWRVVINVPKKCHVLFEWPLAEVSADRVIKLLKVTKIYDNTYLRQLKAHKCPKNFNKKKHQQES